MTLRVDVAASPYGRDGVDFVLEAETLGVHGVWVAEAWGYDALTPLAFLAGRTTTVRLGTGIAQLGARTPAMLAMSAMSMQALSDGRFVLGIGTSGPQVIEGWHGVRFSAPVQRTRETIEIIRTVSRGDRLSFSGSVYELPLPDSAGRAIRSMAPPVDIPIYVASLGPANLQLTGEAADGWIGTGFLPEAADAFLDAIRKGAESAGRTLADVDLTTQVAVELGDDVDEMARRHARGYAFTIGAMGSAGRNFYNDAFARQGYGDEIAEVQRLWLAGDKEAAAEMVPLDLGSKTNLLGPPEVIKERLRAYRDAGITTLRAVPVGDDLATRVDTLGLLLDLVADVNDEGDGT